MRTCADISEDLSAYLDGELPAQERAEVDAHLNGCAVCKAEYESLMSAHAAMASLKKMKAPASLREKVNLEIISESPRLDELNSRRASGRRRRARFSWAMIAAGLAATVLVALLGIYQFYKPTGSVADSHQISDGAHLAAKPTNEAQTAAPGASSPNEEVGQNRAMRQRLNDKQSENGEAESNPENPAPQPKEEALKKSDAPSNASGAERALRPDVRLKPADPNGAAQPMPRVGAGNRSGQDAAKGGAGERDARRSVERAKPADDEKQIEEKIAVEQKKATVMREETKALKELQQSASNAPAAPVPPPKPVTAESEKSDPAKDGVAKSEGLAEKRPEPLAPKQADKPTEPPKTEAAAAPSDKDRAAAFGQAFKSKKEDAVKDAPEAGSEAKKEAADRIEPSVKAADTTLDAKPVAPAAPSPPAKTPAKPGELDFAERAGGKAPAPAANAGGGAAGGYRLPRGRADEAITLRTRDVAALVAKLKTLVEARQVTLALVPVQNVDAANKATIAPEKLAALGKTEYVLTVNADQLAALRIELDALQDKDNLDGKRELAPTPSPPATTAAPVDAKKAVGTVTIRVIIENDEKK